MSRSLLVVAILLLLADAATAAPVPKDAPKFPDFYPTRVGTKWVYLRDNIDEVTEEITGAEERDGAIHLTVRVKVPRDGWENTLVVSKEGLFWGANGIFTIDQWMVRFPVKPGAAWEVHTPLQPGLLAQAGRRTVGEPETVVVPAGTYRAYPVVFAVGLENNRIPDQPKSYTYWYAPQVGMVKLKYPDGKRVLKSFTPGPRVIRFCPDLPARQTPLTSGSRCGRVGRLAPLGGLAPTIRENPMTRRTAAGVMAAVLLGCGGPVYAADVPSDPVEAALAAYCDKHHVKRDRLEPREMGLVPGAKVFRYELPAVPDKQPWRALPVRYAFVFVDGKSGKLTDFKRETYDDPKAGAYTALFEAMKRAGRTVKTEEEATAVLRDLMRLEMWLTSAAADPDRSVKAIKVHGRYRNRPNTFSGGSYGWAGGDDVGLEVDTDGHVTNLLGGHIR